MEIVEVLSEDRHQIVEKLVEDVWEESTRKTHAFLSDEDIKTIKPEVYTELSKVEFLFIIKSQGIIHGFMGIDINRIEMLFIRCNSLSQGYGGALMDYALERFNIKYVDVNEENIGAVGFYEHYGFKTYKRSSYDDLGNPFPVLKMQRV